ncbi:MAG: hypothetical protein ACLUO4_05540 [Christensenellales bacterium]
MVLQKIFAHQNRGFVMGNHAHDKMLRNAVRCFSGKHLLRHLIKNCIVPAEVLLGNLAERCGVLWHTAHAPFIKISVFIYEKRLIKRAAFRENFSKRHTQNHRKKMDTF